MPTKYHVTDSRGETFRRTSNRVYTHCVVIRFKAVPASGERLAFPARSRAEWAGSFSLARRNADSWEGKNHVENVEVIPAVATIPTPSRRTENRIADRIDGYDRDDLGESPDY